MLHEKRFNLFMVFTPIWKNYDSPRASQMTAMRPHLEQMTIVPKAGTWAQLCEIKRFEACLAPQISAE